MPTPVLAVLASGFGWHISDLLRAAEKVGVALEICPFPEVSARVGGDRPRVTAGAIDLEGLNGLLVRMMPPGSLEQVVFRMDAIHRVAAAGVPVWNPPRAIEAAVDKYLALALLASRGLAVPETWAGQGADEALRTFEELGSDVVVKPLFGSEGRGILRVSDRELAWRTFHAIERLGSVIYLQRVIRHPGHDLRVFVLQGRVLAAMRRFATGGEWRTNASLGGRTEAATLDPAVKSLALAAAEAVGTEVAGVDLVEDLDRGELVVLEVNAVPGWKAISGTTGVDVAARILAGLRDQGR
ncbi:ATP-grasp domain-containing protein [Aquisphaera insulae]|uniref:ATP-grasp domain-containing protein n=1 Tax=Aquisphaera insulae TaxID=2712864 RepID=UPI0013EA1B21|nr:RimK family alpha-L-glutamate ligase [Aquisphaera insulae]